MSDCFNLCLLEGARLLDFVKLLLTRGTCLLLGVCLRNDIARSCGWRAMFAISRTFTVFQGPHYLTFPPAVWLTGLFLDRMDKFLVLFCWWFFFFFDRIVALQCFVHYYLIDWFLLFCFQTWRFSHTRQMFYF